MDVWLHGVCFLKKKLHFYFINLFLAGPRGILGSAVACSILIGVFEGVGILVSRAFSERPLPACEYDPPCSSSTNQYISIVPEASVPAPA